MKIRLLGLVISIVSAVFTLGLTFEAIGAVAAQNWVQVNATGFGDPNNSDIQALAPFNGQLYAGTYNQSGSGAQLWRKGDNTGWTAVMTNGFGNINNSGIDHLLEFNGQFYASTEANNVSGGEVWRSDTGLNWTRVVSQGFGDPTNAEVYRMAVYSNTILAGTWSYTSTHGGDIWRSNTGNTADWTRVVTNGFGDPNNDPVLLSSNVFSSYLYVGTYNLATGGEVWRSASGDAGTWTKVSLNGFGTANNLAISSLASFNGYQYAGTRGVLGVSGAQVWRCQTCDGSDWTNVVNNGFGNINTHRNNALIVLGSYLYFVVGNDSTGMEVWRTANGTDWVQVGFGGFGDSKNVAPYWDNSVTIFNDSLYVGTFSFVHGGQIWLYLANQTFLPAVLR